jgi:type III pantothenate kinase
LPQRIIFRTFVPVYKLLLDIGNTTAKAAVVGRTGIVSVQRCDALTGDAQRRLLQPLLHRYRPSVAMVASVRGAAAQVSALLQPHVQKVVVLTSKTPVPVNNLYATPETLGMDRLAAAVGAAHLFPRRDCLIIDCGTAITIDFLSSAGNFLGGNISPGLQARFKALHSFTAQLPMGNVTDKVAEIGVSTREAVEAGVLHGAVKELEGYIEQYPENIPILTGGDVFYFAKKIKKPIFVNCNLIFIGLAKIADYNAYI